MDQMPPRQVGMTEQAILFAEEMVSVPEMAVAPVMVIPTLVT
jgi:hypothetical protein